MRISASKSKPAGGDWLRERATVFLFVALWAGVATALGWAVGFILLKFSVAGEGSIDGGAFFGGWIGLALGGLTGFRRNLFEAEWSRVILIMPCTLWFIFGGLAAACDLPRIFVALVASVGAGAGALLARYWLHFFDPEPPQTIF